MIDLHCHLLPGLDDGPATLEDALAMAQCACDDGITHVMCTSHIQPGRFDNTQTSLQAARAVLNAALQEQQIPLTTALGAEVHASPEVITGVKERTLPYLGRWQERDVLLLEFPHHEWPFGAERLTQWLLEQDVQPLIAHPERNRGLQQTPKKIAYLLDQGCLLQVTASSLLGHFGPDAKTLAHALLQAGDITVLASDAHNMAYRPPILSDAVRYAEQLIGATAAKALVQDNPWTIAQAAFTQQVH